MSFALAGMVVNERQLWHLVSLSWLVVKVPSKVGKAASSLSRKSMRSLSLSSPCSGIIREFRII